jgi:hypothetical protein
MIVGVPDSQELHDTAVGWFNLAWDIVIKAVEEFQEAVELFDDMEKSDGPEKVQDEVDKYWKSSRYKLNNAISLLQQALEIALKSRIAEISPLRWSPKTGQAAKRESSLGTAGWPEVRLVEYTEEAQS